MFSIRTRKIEVGGFFLVRHQQDISHSRHQPTPRHISTNLFNFICQKKSYAHPRCGVWSCRLQFKWMAFVEFIGCRCSCKVISVNILTIRACFHHKNPKVYFFLFFCIIRCQIFGVNIEEFSHCTWKNAVKNCKLKSVDGMKSFYHNHKVRSIKQTNV